MDDSEFWRHEYAFRCEDVAVRVKYQHEFSIAALKSLMLANGGAIIALLTFIGNGKSHLEPGALRWAMLFYGAGLVLGLFTYFGAYMSQGEFVSAASYQMVTAQERMRGNMPDESWRAEADRRMKVGTRYIALAVGLAILSLILFGVGCWQALTGIL